MPDWHALSIHDDYACRRTGACCTSGWTIPVEAPVRRALLTAARDGRWTVADSGHAAFVFPPQLPAGCDAALATTERGACALFEPSRANGCQIHRQLGPDRLPAACRYFPRLGLTDARGTFVTLSHYCPTAAQLLFRTDRDLSVVECPPGLVPPPPREGLDARGALPPLLRPGVLMDLEAYGLWERHLVATLASPDLTPEAALDILTAQVERLRRWTPTSRGEPLVEWLGRVIGQPASPVTATRDWSLAAARARHRRALGAVPPSLRPPTLDDPGSAHDRWVGPTWHRFARPLRHYLAARGFGSWLAYQGHGLRTLVEGLRLALAIVRVQASDLCARRARPIDAATLTQAIRQADLLLVHLAVPDELARLLNRVERRGAAGAGLGNAARRAGGPARLRATAKHATPIEDR